MLILKHAARKMLLQNVSLPSFNRTKSKGEQNHLYPPLLNMLLYPPLLNVLVFISATVEHVTVSATVECVTVSATGMC